MKKNEMRTAFICATIKVMANEGIDKTTTKRISETAGGLNEVYMYRIFDNKERLYKEAFLAASKKLHNKFLKLIPLLDKGNINNEDKWWFVITGFWNYIQKYQDESKCYLQYCYSPYYHKEATQEHKEQYQDILRALEGTFPEGANIELLYNYIFNTVLCFACKELNNETRDVEMVQKVYELIYVALKPHLLNTTI